LAQEASTWYPISFLSPEVDLEFPSKNQYHEP